MPVDFRVLSYRRFTFRSENGNDPGCPSQAYQDMKMDWELIDDLCAGTQVMRDRAEIWLPREQFESIPNYKARLKRSFLFPALKDTIDKVVSRPFSQPVSLVKAEDLDDRLVAMVDDMDGEDTDLTSHARTAFEIMVAYGKVHVYVDFAATGGSQNAAEDKQLTPVCRIISPHDLIGWRSETGPNGKRRLTQIRFRYWENEPAGTYGDKDVEYLLVVNAPTIDGASGTWSRHKLSTDSGKYEKVDEGTHTYPGIPLVTAYARKKGYLKCEPPLMDLAHLNLAHWQSASDQRNALRFARIGMFAATGITPDEYDKTTTLAPTNMFKSISKDAKYYHVEHSGAAIAAGQEEVKHLEEQMEVVGSAPFIHRSASSTATGKQIDAEASSTDVKAWVRIGELLWKTVFKVAATWIKVELPESFGVNIFDDYTITGSQADNEFLLKCRTAGELSRGTFLSEVKRRGTIAESVDVDEETAAIESEGPSFAQQLDQAKLDAARQMGNKPDLNQDDPNQGDSPMNSGGSQGQ